MRALVGLLAACSIATTASAATVDQIVQLSKAGISEAVILALIDRDHSVMTIDPEQIIALKHEGLSDTVITAMLQSGRDEGEAAAAAVSAWNAAAMLADMASTPTLVVVGHGPSEPDPRRTPYLDRWSPTYVTPYAPYAHGRRRGSIWKAQSDEPSSSVGVVLPSISGFMPSISGLQPIAPVAPERGRRR